MVFYLLKSIACLLVFFAFYKMVLEDEKAHVIKRIYLLTSLVLAITIPLITFTEVVEVAFKPIASKNFAVQMVAETPAVVSINYWELILWSVYGLGVLVFSVRFIRNLLKIVHDIQHNKTLKSNFYTKVLMLKAVVPHSFLDYVFLNRDSYEDNAIPKVVLKHEEAHVQQRHSIDILFMELLQIVFWFNPLLYWYKKAIKLNHEFLADAAVITSNTESTAYQNILVNFSSGAHHSALSSPLNYSLTKKRILMLSKHTSRLKWLKLLAILPLLSILIFSFSSREVIQKVAMDSKEKPVQTQATISQQDTKKLILSITPKTIVLNKKTVSLKNLTKRLNSITKNWTQDQLQDFSMAVSLNDVETKRILAIEEAFKKSALGKANPNEVFVLPPPPPPAPPKPTSEGEKLPPPPPPASRTNVSKGFKMTGYSKENSKTYYYVAKGNDTLIYDRFGNTVNPESLNEDEKSALKRLNSEAGDAKARVKRLKKEQEKLVERRQELKENVNALRDRQDSKYEEILEERKKMVEIRSKEIENREAEIKERAESLGEMATKLKREVALSKQARQEAESRKAELVKFDTRITKRYKDGRVVEEYELPDVQPLPVVPPPPPPIEPKQLITKMAALGASFYLEDKKISADKALEIVKRNADINILSNEKEKKVKLSIYPISTIK